jgi:Domain of unknown function (DUF4167)
MRSSKNRSRSKSNRQRTIGNIINRVFDSSGPESKVRGTPQQIIEKYLQLARDAQLSNDRVAEQNFLQHAEHYTRMLGEATAEMQREQDARQQYGNQQGGQSNNGQNNNGQNNNGGQVHQGNQGDRQSYQNRDRYENNRPQDRDESGYSGYAGDPQPDVVAEPRAGSDEGPGIVETPEARSQSQRRNDQRPRDERPREERPREERPREDRPRDERPREEKPRDDRRKSYQDRREPVAAAQPAVAVLEEPSALPAFITAAAPMAEPKVARAPRKPRVKAEVSDDTPPDAE